MEDSCLICKREVELIRIGLITKINSLSREHKESKRQDLINSIFIWELKRLETFPWVA